MKKASKTGYQPRTSKLPFALSILNTWTLTWIWWHFDPCHEILKCINLHQVLCEVDLLSQCQPDQNGKMSTWPKIKSFSKSTLSACRLMFSCCFRIILTLDTSLLQSCREFLQNLDSARAQPLRLQMPGHKRSDCSSCLTQIHKPEIRFHINAKNHIYW